MALPPRSLKLLLLALVALAAGLALWALPGRAVRESPAGPRTPLGLFTTLPIYWGESAQLSDVLDGSARQHWARAAIEREHELRPLDVLTPEALSGLGDLLIAQPRVLSPAENVALDAWVRAGGDLLLFADPMLTQASPFAIGDKRRPQDVVLLSPLLAHWGLRLEFDESQPLGEREIGLLGAQVPVDLPGRFALEEEEGGPAGHCRLLAGDSAADCAIGKGHALIVADAALLDGRGADPDARAAALSRLMAKAYAAR